MSQTTVREYRGRRESVNVEGGILKEKTRGGIRDGLEVRVDIGIQSEQKKKQKKQNNGQHENTIGSRCNLFYSNVLNQVIHDSGAL